VRKLATTFGLSINLPVTDVKTSVVLSDVENKVKEFYESDLVSHQLPGKKDFVTVLTDEGKKEKVQKKVLMMTVMEAYKSFKTEFLDCKIGKSKFATLRPQHVVPVCDKDHNVCCCRYHEDIDLLLDGIRKLSPTLVDGNGLVSQSACDWSMNCYLGECEVCKDIAKFVGEKLAQDVGDDTPCSYYQWMTTNQKELVQTTFDNAQQELVHIY